MINRPRQILVSHICQLSVTFSPVFWTFEGIIASNFAVTSAKTASLPASFGR